MMSTDGWVGACRLSRPLRSIRFSGLITTMIDRLWAIWQNSSVGEAPPVALLDTVLAPFPMTVRETLHIRRLGYDYAVQASG